MLLPNQNLQASMFHPYSQEGFMVLNLDEEFFINGKLQYLSKVNIVNSLMFFIYLVYLD